MVAAPWWYLLSAGAVVLATGLVVDERLVGRRSLGAGKCWVVLTAAAPMLLPGSPLTLSRSAAAETARPELLLPTGHTGGVAAVAFSPDGTRIVTGSDDGSAILWEAATGRRIRSFEGQIGWLDSVAFSPDGRHLLTSGSATAILWDALSGKHLWQIEGFVGFAGAEFDRQGQQVMTVALDGTTTWWDAATGKKLRTVDGRSDTAFCAAFSPDRKQVLLGRGDRLEAAPTVLWDVATGTKLEEFRGHVLGVNAVAFDPEGGRILTGSYDGKAILWDATNGKKLWTFGPKISPSPWGN
ncbi:MAG: WD40 repeat domain-containing protein, partial [Planctomycetota bacterium]